jgi:hypothetical protein
MIQASLMDMGFKISKSVSIKRDVGVGARIILKWILKMHKDAYSNLLRIQFSDVIL